MTFKSQPTNLLAPVSFKDSRHTKNLEGVLSFAGFLHFLEAALSPLVWGRGERADAFSHLLPSCSNQGPGRKDQMAAGICTRLILG